MAQTIVSDTFNTLKAETNKYENVGIDLVDVLRDLKHNKSNSRKDTGELKSAKPRISAIPVAGYTLATGFAAVATANAVFYTNKNANNSTILASFNYTARNQIIIPIAANIWLPDNKYNIVLDWRYLKFPSYTYGLGEYTALTDGYLIDYSTVHFHQTVLRKVINNLYGGIGYNFDYYWNIKEIDPPPNKITDFENYGFNPVELASGFTFNALYDNRTNSINPDNGYFANIIYKPNLTIFGNTATWRSFILEARKYIKLPTDSKNVLAFWTYEWFTISGKPPYLMLPNTGNDPYNNTGRGYIQGRFRGSNMVYLETEYRFGISNNGLIGGVLFANAESFSLPPSNKFETISPGWGAGIRIKLNKYSNTNVAVDYGFGTGGSGGVFVNLGEVF